MNEPVSRYEFLRSVGRNGILLGLGGMGVAALHGSKDPSECMNTNMCASCNVYHGCTLPEKKEARREREDQLRPA